MEREIILTFLDQLSPETIAVIEADVKRITALKEKESLQKQIAALQELKAEGIDKRISSLTTQMSAVEDIIK